MVWHHHMWFIYLSSRRIIIHQTIQLCAAVSRLLHSHNYIIILINFFKILHASIIVIIIILLSINYLIQEKLCFPFLSTNSSKVFRMLITAFFYQLRWLTLFLINLLYTLCTSCLQKFISHTFSYSYNKKKTQKRILKRHFHIVKQKKLCYSSWLDRFLRFFCNATMCCVCVCIMQVYICQ